MANVDIQGSSFDLSYRRTTYQPLDSSSVFNTYNDASVYALNNSKEKAYVPYAGQIISVLENNAIYKLIPAKDVEEIEERKGKPHFELALIGSKNDNDDRYVRKDIAETIQKLMTFIEGINVKGMATLAEITLLKDLLSQNFSVGSTGFGIYRDEVGNYHLDIDFVNIRRKLTADEIQVQRSYYVGGKQWVTPGAGIVCTSVEDTGSVYRCHFKTTDADGREVKCLFQADDRAICETFNLDKKPGGTLGNHYYWRLVVGVGTDYIDLSKSDCDAGSDAPLAGDEIVHLGNKSDRSRQGAICSDAITTGGPYIRVYKGISDYHLPQPNIDLNPEESIIKARFISIATGKDIDTQLNELQGNLDIIKGQTDKEYTMWFYDYAPTLSNIPASEWTTNTLKVMHEQDMFYNRESGLAYRFEKSGNTWAWNNITDLQTIKALEDAARAQDTADGKRRTFVAQPTDSQAYDVGDIWVNATYPSSAPFIYKDDTLVCKTAKAKGAIFSISHWQPSSSATTSYLENLGDQILAGATSSKEGIAAVKKLAEEGIVEAKEMANDAIDSINSAVTDIKEFSKQLGNLSDKVNGVDDTLVEHTTAIQATKDSIALLAQGKEKDENGNIVNINKSGLVTTAYFNSLFSERVEFDENGHITNTTAAGFITAADFSTQYAQMEKEDGLIKRSEISTFITRNVDGSFTSTALIDADKILFNGHIVANGTFIVGEDGNLTLNKITVNNVTANDMIANNLIANSGTFNGSINASNGYIGAFKINGYGLVNVDENPLACIQIEKNGGKFFRVNDSEDSMCSIRGDSITALSISAYGDNSVGLDIIAQAGVNSYAINSYGDVSFITRQTESAFIQGVRVSTRIITTSGNIHTNDDFLRFTSHENLTLTMPSPSSCPGKVYYLKQTAGSVTFTNGPFISPNGWETKDTYTLSGTYSMMLISDGSSWFFFYCG
ncbi:hypothetical protein [uncultured Bacteroides sp.]|uniref:hypothetical protein n=1 Tax=uncultured Bacteroides sp. TaxID=162156 RepID=UPI0025FE4F62|nr:hypothetical protein [uncultured Bacteroides sp.]